MLVRERKREGEREGFEREREREREKERERFLNFQIGFNILVKELWHFGSMKATVPNERYF